MAEASGLMEGVAAFDVALAFAWAHIVAQVADATIRRCSLLIGHDPHYHEGNIVALLVGATECLQCFPQPGAYLLGLAVGMPPYQLGNPLLAV